MGEVSTIGLDIAKSVFQVHGVDVAGAVVIRKRVSRAKVLEYFGELPQCLVGIEACPSAHHWGRELQVRGAILDHWNGPGTVPGVPFLTGSQVNLLAGLTRGGLP